LWSPTQLANVCLWLGLLLGLPRGAVAKPGGGRGRGHLPGASPVTLTVEIFPQNRPKWPLSREYLDSQRTPHSPHPPPHQRGAWARQAWTGWGAGLLGANARMGAGLAGASPVTLTVEIFPQNRPKRPLSREYLDSERTPTRLTRGRAPSSPRKSPACSPSSACSSSSACS